MGNVITCLIFILFSVQASAGAEIQLKTFLGNFRCADKLEKLIQKWNSRGEWRVDIDNKHQPIVIKSPTQKLGTWIVLEKNEKTNQIILMRVSAKTHLEVSWKENCKSSLQNIAVKKDSTRSNQQNIFDDAALEKLMALKKPGLIYAYSPQMHLSVEGIDLIKKLAKNLKINLQIVVEPLKSNELFMRGFGHHYPSLIVYSKDGNFSGIYPGRKSNAEYKSFIEGFLQ